jgi:hypothetical protein
MSILKLLSSDSYIAYNKQLAKEVGVDEAIVFGELCSICNIHAEEFYFEQHRIIDETCLTEYRIRNALKNLRDFGLVSVTKKGLPAKNYYSLNEKVLVEIISRSTSGIKFDTTGDYKIDTTITNTTNNTNTSKENTTKKKQTKSDYEAEFEEIWLLYPRKELKSLGLKHYISARKNGTTYEEIKDGVERYSAHCKIKETDKDYITKGGNFFYKKLWSDDFDMTPKTTTKTYGANRTVEKPESEMSEADRIMWAEIDRVNGEYNNKNG